MTPIDPKDRPKVIALIVALAAVILFAVRYALGALAPSANRPATTTATTQPTTSVPPSNVPPQAPTPVPGFSEDPRVAMQEPGPANPFRSVLPQNRPKPNPPPQNSTSPPRNGGRPTPLPSTGTAGTTPVQPLPPPEPGMVLNGIVTRGDRTAVILAREGTGIYKVGQRVAGTYLVTQVNKNDVRFRGPRGIFRLQVGEQRAGSESTTADGTKVAEVAPPSGGLPNGTVAMADEVPTISIPGLGATVTLPRPGDAPVVPSVGSPASRPQKIQSAEIKPLPKPKVEKTAPELPRVRNGSNPFSPPAKKVQPRKKRRGKRRLGNTNPFAPKGKR